MRFSSLGSEGSICLGAIWFVGAPPPSICWCSRSDWRLPGIRTHSKGAVGRRVITPPARRAHQLL